MKKIFFFLILVNFLLKAEGSVTVLEKFQEISSEDQEKIHYFFEKLIKQYGFGYTLFGEKPVSMLYWLAIPEHDRKRPYFSVDENFVEAYKIWKKHEGKFSSEKYFFEERSLVVGKEYVDLILINKSEFYKKIFLHSNLFPDHYDERAFINNEKMELFSKEDLGGYHLRMGVLLGYGEGNASEFAKRTINDPKESPDWVVFKDLIRTKKNKNTPNPPVFRANPHTQETQKLIENYSQTQEKLEDILNNENFLQIVLEEYCSAAAD